MVAVNAGIVSNLQLQRSVAKGTASFYTFGTTNAQWFINGILKERILDELSFDGIGRAKLVLRCRIQGFCSGFEIPAA